MATQEEIRWFLIETEAFSSGDQIKTMDGWITQRVADGTYRQHTSAWIALMIHVLRWVVQNQARGSKAYAPILEAMIDARPDQSLVIDLLASFLSQISSRFPQVYARDLFILLLSKIPEQSQYYRFLRQAKASSDDLVHLSGDLAKYAQKCRCLAEDYGQVHRRTCSNLILEMLEPLIHAVIQERILNPISLELASSFIAERYRSKCLGDMIRVHRSGLCYRSDCLTETEINSALEQTVSGSLERYLAAIPFLHQDLQDGFPIVNRAWLSCLHRDQAQERAEGPALEFQDQHHILEHAIQAFCESRKATCDQPQSASKMDYYKTVLLRTIGSVSVLHLELFQGSDLSDLVSLPELARAMLVDQNCVIRSVIALGELTKEQIIGDRLPSEKSMAWLEEMYRPSPKSARSCAAACY